MTIRIVQVGLGGWGRNWAMNVLSQNKDIELVACVDIETASLAYMQQKLNLPANRCFTTLEAALGNVESDAVLITASLAAHVPAALSALHAGKHVLIEKPFAPTLVEAQRVVETAEQQGRIVMVSQNYRYFPAVQAVKALLHEQALGAVGSVNIDFRRYANTAPRESNNFHYKLWQPLLVDMSIHHFDLMRYVLNQEAQRVSCHTWNPPWSNFDEASSAAATLTFDGGAVVSYRGSWVSQGPQTDWSGEWHMECERGEIIWTSRGEIPDSVTVRERGKRTRNLRLPDYPLQDRHGSLHAFVQAVQTGQEPESSGRNNLKTLALMLTSVEASITGEPMMV